MSYLPVMQTILCTHLHVSDKIRNVKSRVYSLPVNLHKHELYLLRPPH